jgi:dihydrofolate reductase
MGKVILKISMSLDGFIAGPQGDIEHLFKWGLSGNTEIATQDGRMVLKMSPQSARVFEESLQTSGIMVAGRRVFDQALAWDGHPPIAPCIIVTHTVPQQWAREGSPFTFVTDGVQSAIRQAKAVAGEKNVIVETPSMMQQCLKAGLLDEMHVDLVPVLLGSGTRLFDDLKSIAPLELESIRVVEAPGVTHLAYRVIK